MYVPVWLSVGYAVSPTGRHQTKHLCVSVCVSTGQPFAFSQATREAYGWASWGKGMHAKGQQKPRSHGVRTKKPQEGTLGLENAF